MKNLSTKRPCAIKAYCGVLLMVACGAGGCNRLGLDWYRWFNPSKVVAKPSRQPILPILRSLTLVDETQEMLPNAEPPVEDDYIYTDSDYVLGPTDVVDIMVMDLYTEGAPATVRKEISESGQIDLPLLPERILAEGLTKDGLKELIIDAYSPEILRAPVVSVSIVVKRHNVFSIIGSGRTGSYTLARKDMRLLDALALAGGVPNTNVPYLYVIRPRAASRRRTAEARRARKSTVEELPGLPAPVPPAPAPPTTAPAGADGEPTGAQTRQRELRALILGHAGGRPSQTLPPPSDFVTLSETTPSASAPSTRPAGGSLDVSTSPPKWIYTGNRWVRVQPGAQEPKKTGGPPTAPAPADRAPETAGGPEDPYGWARAEKKDLARIVAINYKRLFNGDPKMNIIIRDRDVIQIPVPETGEFYLMGEVQRPGVYSLRGQRITIKQAIAAGGNLGPLAWPENAYLIRRIGPRKEQIVPLDIDAIFRGETPDIFLKPHDVIAVGTDILSPFLTVFRNAFRFAYGFGFTYDRNFSDPAPRGLDHRRFTIW